MNSIGMTSMNIVNYYRYEYYVYCGNNVGIFNDNVAMNNILK